MSAAPPAARLASVYFAYFAYVGAMSPYFGLYLLSVGASAWQIGVLLGVMQLARVIAPNLWAAAADRSGERAMLLRWSVAGGTVAFAGLWLTQSFAGMLVVLAAHAMLTAGANPLLEAITLASLRDRISRYGAIRLWGSVGFILAVSAVGWQLDHFPIATVLATILATLLLTFLATLGVPRVAGAARASPAPLAPILRDPALRALLAACFLMTVAHGPLYAFYSIYLADHGYAKSTIGVLWSIGVVAEIAVFWLQPRWALRFSMESVFAASLACAVLRFVMIGYGVESFALLAVAQVLHGASFGSYHVAALALVHRRFGEGAQARGQALYTSVSYGAGGVVGALASGLAWESIGPAATFAAASLVALAGLLVSKSRRTIPASNTHN